MTLATRCPKCGTTFRVVSDQLKLRKGLVKCGMCAQVFNGVEFLHYFSEAAPNAPEQEALPAASPAPIPTPQYIAEAPASAGTDSRIADADIATPNPTANAIENASAYAISNLDASSAPSHAALRAESPAAPVRQTEEALVAPASEDAVVAPAPDTGSHAGETIDAANAVASNVAADARVEPVIEASAPFDDQPFAESAPARRDRDTTVRHDDAPAQPFRPDATSVLAPLTLLDIARDGESAPTVDTFEEIPTFLRERRRTPRWLRFAIAGLAVVAAAALAGQLTYIYRAEIAAYLPSARAALESGCAALPDALRCEVGLPRHITQLRVTGADLQPASGGDFSLSVGIHNDGSLPQAFPTLDVMLTNVRNQLVVRRSITPGEYLRARPDATARMRNGIAPGNEESIALRLRIKDETVIGYTVGIFYP